MAYNTYNTDYKEQTEWNMDDEVCKIIKDMKKSFLVNLKQWQLDEAYWDLNLIWGEIDSLLDDSERAKIENDMKILEKVRKTKNNKEERGEYWMKLHNVYRELCQLMQEHGVYFRIQYEEEGL